MTKFPISGEVKSRLIPAIGAFKAAELSRRMTEYVCSKINDTNMEIEYVGGTRDKFLEWLGDSFIYRPQKGENLGIRMSNAIISALEDGMEKIIVIGTDCPYLSKDFIKSAFNRLNNVDVVIGPAADGGYYLLGVKSHQIDLFKDINWGTTTVFGETVNRIRSSNLSYCILPELSDIDRPEDIYKWERYSSVKPKLSVIIPTFNEADNISKTLNSIKCEHVESIISDGYSTDETIQEASSKATFYMRVKGGRALQLNEAARFARGDNILFLHADSVVPQNYVDVISSILANNDVAVGSFSFKTDHESGCLKIIEKLTNFRSKILKMPYGDQGFFLRRDAFNEIGGFPEVPIMEDYIFIKKAKKHGSVKIAHKKCTTSSRRWKNIGVIKVTLINQIMIAGYHLGIPLKTLGRLYRGKKFQI